MLRGKVVIVSGGMGRIGLALAKGVVGKGGKVVFADITDEGENKLSKEFTPQNAMYVRADITKTNEIDRLIEVALEQFGQVDGAVHAAYPRSSAWGTRFEELEAEFLKEDLCNQLGGAILFSQSILRHFLKQGHGNLVHISSIQGVTAPKFEHYEGLKMTSPIEYSAIKSGIIAITRWLAKYHKQKNIRVNCVSPGGVLDEQPPVLLERYQQACTSKGMLSATDVVGALVFLLSEDSKYINGQNIVIDDGWSL